MTLREEFRDVLNRYSAENKSNTPDYILATYLEDCLQAFDRAVMAREAWYGRCVVLEHLMERDESNNPLSS